MILNWLGWVFIALAILTLAAGVWMFRTAPYIEYVDPVDEALHDAEVLTAPGRWGFGDELAYRHYCEHYRRYGALPDA